MGTNESTGRPPIFHVSDQTAHYIGLPSGHRWVRIDLEELSKLLGCKCERMSSLPCGIAWSEAQIVSCWIKIAKTADVEDVVAMAETEVYVKPWRNKVPKKDN